MPVKTSNAGNIVLHTHCNAAHEHIFFMPKNDEVVVIYLEKELLDRNESAVMLVYLLET